MIGIGGISRAGKTFLADLIADRLPLLNAPLIIHLDDYVKPHAELPLIKEHIDWEIPDSIDYSRALEEIAGSPRNLVIVEGHLAFCNSELDFLYQRRIHINLDESEFRARKEQDQRWGEEPSWYIDYIWEAYLRYGKPTDSRRFLSLDGGKDFSIEQIMEYLFG